jgi:DNA-binding NarL/FixJ family response regulator
MAAAVLTETVRVFVHATDPILEAGAIAKLGQCSLLDVSGDPELANVALVVCDESDDEAARLVRTVAEMGCPRVVLLVARLDKAGMLCGSEAGTLGFVRRSEAVPARLQAVIVAVANGEAFVPPDLVGPLLAHVRNAAEQALFPSMLGLSDREREVLKLIAEGCETADIAQRLCYSERTVKSVVHQLTTRLHCKNRAQAVALAVRQGLI